MAKAKFVFQFGGGVAETDVTSKDILGGKGSGLMEMTKIDPRRGPAALRAPHRETHHRDQS